MKQKITLSKLENFLFSLADELRSKMDANDYKYYIIGLIFIKRLSDEFVKAQDVVKNKYAHLPPEFLAQILEDKTSYGDLFFVPKEARWYEGYTDKHGQKHSPIKDVKSNIGERLNIAIAAIEEGNDRLSGVLKNNIDFNAQHGKSNQVVKDADWKNLIEKLSSFERLSGENFEFPDLLGAAYEYLIKYFADSAGKKGGEFYTPAEVVRLMVQLVNPQEGDSIYDPTVGSGGMLIQSHQFVEENGQNTHRIKLNGQENDGGVWATCIMNMILHDVKDFEIEHGNTLEEPLFKDHGGKYKKFDKILANPPFSLPYKKLNLTQTSRFRWGYAPENKKADLMFVQHMASSLKQKGLMASVVPHGVLFRGSAEKKIRAAMLEDNIIDAVIGLPHGLFYGTGIPAAVIVIKKNRKDDEGVLFINADAEYAQEKARNRLRARDIEKISFVYRTKDDSDPKYSKLVSLKEIKENDYNLNIRRYVDNSKPTEIEDAKAHLFGGVPKREVAEHTAQFEKFGFDYSSILRDRGGEYLEFADDTDGIKERIEDDESVKAALREYEAHLGAWWSEAREEFGALEETKNINRTKQALLASFKKHFARLKTLDGFQTAGVFVEWWNSVRYDLKTISAIGFNESLLDDEMLTDVFFGTEKESIESLEGQISMSEAELAEAVDEVEYESEEDSDKDAKSAKEYLKGEIKRLEYEEGAEYVAERAGYEAAHEKIENLEKKIKELKAQKKEAEHTLKLKLEIKRYGTAEEVEKIVEALSNIALEIEANKNKPKELKKLEAKQKEARKKESAIKVLISETPILTHEEAKELTLNKHHALIQNELDKSLKEELGALVKIFDNLSEKYKKSLRHIEDELKKAESKIDGYLRALGYIG